jgi:long-chain acyl-CoA synthetase
VNFWGVFDAAATRFGDRIAIEVQRRESLERHTYHDLRDTALCHAAWLKTQGIAAGDRCAIFADNDVSWCAAYLGILRIGAIAVPLDTDYSVAQLQTILQDSGARVLFVNERLSSLAAEAGGNLPAVVVYTLGAPGRGPEVPRDMEPADVGEDGAAVILYTSGTTGDPKGVVLTHTNLIAERDAAIMVIDVSERDSVLGVLPLFHALAQLANLLLPFAVGARVVFVETLSSTELLRALNERGITICACVPQFLYMLHERLLKETHRRALPARVMLGGRLSLSFLLRRVHINAGAVIFRRVHNLLGRRLRVFITGGSKVDRKIGRDFHALGFSIVQAYGLTETSGAVTLTRPDEAHLDTVGHALPGQEIKILPPTRDDLDGEIAIRGPIVMRGYFNRPDLTRPVMANGWFLSGDLGRLDGQGRLTVTGRSEEVIVLANGRIVHPDEVEAQYRQSTFIKEICVIGVTPSNERNAERPSRLFAVVVPDAELLRERRIVNAGDLLRFELEGQSIHLPPYKRVLDYAVWFAPLPRTTTGNLKRHAIERRLQASKEQPIADPSVPSEIARRWRNDAHAAATAEIVRARARGRVINAEANLELDLGFDSMERVELLTELEQRFAVRVPVDKACEILTLGQLIDAVRPARDGPVAESIEGSWSVLLRDVPAPTDSAHFALLARRPVAAPVFFLTARLLRLFLGPGEVAGRANLPQHGPYIISPNHQSYVDPFIVLSVLPYHLFRNLFFVGASEYFDTRLTRWLARKINLLPVDPDANLVSAMQASARGLRHGKILMLFPEGERSIDGTVKRFKKGAPILAQHLGVAIVPVAIKGAHELWPRNCTITWRLLMPWNRHRVRVAFGAPMQFNAMADYAASAAQLRGAVDDVWQRL